VTSPFRHSSADFTSRQWGTAWLVHLFTTLGIVAAMLSLRDVLVGRPDYAILWMLLTLLIDGVDGPIARALEVERRVPLIDGFLLDLIIDYVTCVIVPAVFMYQFDVVPQNNYGIAVLCVLVFASAIWFARKDMMSEDNWFRGFPAAWNMVAPLLFLLDVKTWIGAVITIVLSIGCLANFPFPHIARAKFMQAYTLVAAVLWLGGLTVGAILYPHRHDWITVVIYVGSLYFFLVSALKAVQDHRVRKAGVSTPPVHGIGATVPAQTTEDSAAEGR
jgi:phosphatidylcholine synthase